MTRTATLALATLAALGLAAPHTARAQQFDGGGNAYFSTGGPFTVNYVITGIATVGRDINGHSNDPNTLQPYDPTVTLVSGGSAFGFGVFNASTLNVSGGSTGGNNAVVAGDTSTVNITGGDFVDSGGSGGVTANDNSTLRISGGRIGAVQAHNGGTDTISGGTFGQFAGINFFDGTFGAGTLTFVGTGLSATPTGPDPGYGGQDYLLTGLLQDGSSVTGDVVNVAGNANMFTLTAAPEPSQFAALALGALGLSSLVLRARRRRAA